MKFKSTPANAIQSPKCHGVLKLSQSPFEVVTRNTIVTGESQRRLRRIQETQKQ